MATTVFVSGCFDLLHSGHVAFLERAATFGELVVAVGSDRTLRQLKGRAPCTTEDERLFVISALRCVRRAFVSKGSGILDFKEELRAIQPSFFIVNTDGDHASKRDLCAALGVEYVVLEREPVRGLPRRCTTELRGINQIPYRLELSGGWLDQPIVSLHASGNVIVASVWLDFEVQGRTGLATSSHATAQRIWNGRIPAGDPVELARVLFACENPPGTLDVAGSQDAIGIVLPGVNRLRYEGGYWPVEIESDHELATAQWIESVVHLVPLGPRPRGFAVREGERITAPAVLRLATSSQRTWHAIKTRNLTMLGQSLSECLAAQSELFPATLNPLINEAIAALPKNTTGCKMTGAGGGGFLLVAAPERPPNALSYSIRLTHE